MATLSKELIQKVRQQNDIVEIIGEYVQLERRGRNYFGLCPFHDENSPSFSVTSDKQIFHCFGCGEGGSVFDFLMLKEGLSFVDTVKYLAERANVNLPQLDNQKTNYSKDQQIIVDSHEHLEKYYHFVLRNTEEGQGALRYLKEREISETTINELSIGFAPEESETTVKFLNQQKFHQQELIKNNVLTESNGHVNDPFRGRVIFPIKDHLGRTVAFGGRTLGDQKPKYLNSPENAMFQKSRLLYNLYKSKNFIRKQKQVIIFEGYMDVIAAHQAGIKHTVASLGTTLSDYQVQMLKRYTNEIVLCFDSDEAGITGMLQAAQVIQKHHMNVRFATINGEMDPDDFIREKGSEVFLKQVIDPSETYFKFLMRYELNRTNLAIDSEKINLLEKLIKNLSHVKSDIEREIYAKEMSNIFQVSFETIIHKTNQLKSNNNIDRNEQRAQFEGVSPKMQQQKYNKLRAFERAERLLISYMLQKPHIYQRVENEIGNNFNVPLHQIIVTRLYAHVEENHGEIILEDFIDRLEEKEEKQLIAELSMIELNDDVSDEEISDYIQVIFQESNVHSKLNALKEQLKEYERINDYSSASKVAKEIIDLNRTIKKINL